MREDEKKFYHLANFINAVIEIMLSEGITNKGLFITWQGFLIETCNFINVNEMR